MKSRLLKVFFAIAGVVLAIAACFVASPGRLHPRAGTGSTGAEVMTFKPPLDGHERQALRRGTAVLARQSPGGSPARKSAFQSQDAVKYLVEPSESTGHHMSSEEVTFRQQQSVDRAYNLFEHALATEPRDSNSTQKTVDQLRAVTAKIPGTKALDMECRSSFCRVTLEHENLENQQSLADAIGNEPPFNGGTMYRYEGEANPPRTILYVAALGHTFGELVQRIAN